MNILFAAYGELSISGGNARSASILRVLADAGHRVDVVAGKVVLPDHPNIRLLTDNTTGNVSRRRIRVAVRKASGRTKYDAVHAVDDAAVFVSRLWRFRRLPLIYDASRCLTGPVGRAPSWIWKLFPQHFRKKEVKILQRAVAVLVPSETLALDLKNIVSETPIVQVEDVPVQPLFPARSIDRASLLNRFKNPVSSVLAVCVLPGKQRELRKLMMAVRKFIDAVPHAVVFLKGVDEEKGTPVATNLDILEQCVFLDPNETAEYLSVLDIADALLMVPSKDGRYVHPEVFALLQSPAPLVVVQDEAYGELLNSKNSVQVLYSQSAIVEGVLQIIREPLLSIAITTEGQQLIADHYSLSSFKHKIRMTYHEVLSKE